MTLDKARCVPGLGGIRREQQGVGGEAGPGLEGLSGAFRFDSKVIGKLLECLEQEGVVI